MVDREEAFLLGIAVTIAEVATVGMQYHEELGVVTSHQATQVGEHIGVVEAALGLAELLAYRVVLVALHSEEVDVAMIARLIGDVCRVEASLTEGREDALHLREFVRARGVGMREDDGDTLVGGIRLGEHVGEGDEPTSVHTIEPRGRGARVAVETPAVGTGSLPEDEHVDLSLFSGALRLGMEGKVLACPIVVEYLMKLLRRQVHIVEDAHRVDLCP